MHDADNCFDCLLYGDICFQFQVIFMDGLPLHASIYCGDLLCSHGVKLHFKQVVTVYDTLLPLLHFVIGRLYKIAYLVFRSESL